VAIVTTQAFATRTAGIVSCDDAGRVVSDRSIVWITNRKMAAGGPTPAANPMRSAESTQLT